MDPNNPVVRLCVAGMEAEGKGDSEDALKFFTLAWEARKDDFDAAIAAHYIARHQTSLEDTLHWNEVALAHADEVKDGRAADFYPSLYLNVGHAHEALGNIPAAKLHYELAEARVDELPDNEYTVMIRRGLMAAIKRLG
ncbi:hypothetical protein EON81_01885 [bacterium]|nr:MAG: hypothetical protein EON81_01885 [bacterium]